MPEHTAAFASPLLVVSRGAHRKRQRFTCTHVTPLRFPCRPPSRTAHRQPSCQLTTEKQSSANDSNVPENKPLPRWFRIILTSLSVGGLAETSYLTLAKLFQTAGSICSTQGCLDVLTGPYSSVFGIPLSALGMLTYGTLAILSMYPLLSRSQEEFIDVDAGTTSVIPASIIYARRDAATRPLLLATSTAMLIFSTYLMALLTFVIRDMCPYCIISALLSLSLFMLTFRTVPHPRPIIAASAGAAALAAALSFAIAFPNARNQRPPDTPQAPPAVTERSTAESLRIARKLKLLHTRMYGAYWCTHCFDQKQRFGKRGFDLIEYVECDPHGKLSQSKLCRQKRIPGYPTWEINGKLYPGEISLEQLDQLAD